MISLQLHCILGLAEIQNFASQRKKYAQKMQDAQVKNHWERIHDSFRALLMQTYARYLC